MHQAECSVKGFSKLHGLGAVTGQSHTEQSAECEEGMPPESTMALKSQMPLRQRRVKICSAAEILALHTPHDRWCQHASGLEISLRPVASKLESLQLQMQAAPSCYAFDNQACNVTMQQHDSVCMS